MFEVMKKRCDQCLFGANKIVSEKRKLGILRDIRENGGFFICHKSTIQGGDACCRGFFDEEGEGSRTVKMAKSLGVVKFIEEDKPR